MLGNLICFKYCNKLSFNAIIYIVKYINYFCYDLHILSKYSDVKCTLNEILDLAVKNNVSVLSLTEHYNLSSLYLARKFVKTESKYNGIEIAYYIVYKST